MEMEVDSSIWTVGMKKFNDSRISSLRDNLFQVRGYADPHRLSLFQRYKGNVSDSCKIHAGFFSFS